MDKVNHEGNVRSAASCSECWGGGGGGSSSERPARRPVSDRPASTQSYSFQSGVSSRNNPTYALIYRVAQKECNNFDSLFQEHRRRNGIVFLFFLVETFIFQQNDTIGCVYA